MTAISLERRIQIETPEQTILSYTLAGVGSRAGAAIVDLFIIVVVEFGLFLLIQQIGSAATSHIASAQRTSGAWAYAVGALVAYAMMWGYYVFFEAIWDGQTPGKRWLDIRVVQDGGYSVSFGASAVRNIVRFLDLQPVLLYAVGLVSMTVSKSGKRLGDIAAGTIVVHEQRALIAAAVRSAPEASTAPAITSRLTEEEFALLGRFIARRSQLDGTMQANFARQLATRFEKHLPTDVRGRTDRLVRLFELESDSRARGLPSPGAKGAARERHAIVAINAERWRDFSTALTVAQRRGLKSMTPQQVSELVSLYRQVSTDLARLRTASDSEDQDAIFYVSRLLGAGHNFLYRQRGLSTRDV
ncbi:MAG TPA: RDD family protein, partial [Gemmatimonadaceae bacterium]|nr:RDD family protein [Gemmatimonadaceae bacterium]